jgi:hypothetical protein
MLLEVEYECFLKYYHVPKDGQLHHVASKQWQSFLQFSFTLEMNSEQWIEKQNVEIATKKLVMEAIV